MSTSFFVRLHLIWIHKCSDIRVGGWKITHFWNVFWRICNSERLCYKRNFKVSFSKCKFYLKSDHVNLLHRLALLSVCFIYPMSGRYSTIRDQKGWPGSEIQMYYGCPCKGKIVNLHWGSPELKLVSLFQEVLRFLKGKVS